jgi:hypothetical protein
MELRHLRALWAIVEHGGFRAAARTWGMTQPSLSEQVQQLETEVGLQLLDVLAQGRLGHPQFVGRAAKSAVLDDADKTAQMPQFHDRPILS